MTVVAEGIAIKSAEAVLTSVARTVGRRLMGGMSPATRRSRKRSNAIAQMINSLDFSGRLMLLGLIKDLPHGVSIARVDRILGSLPMQGVLQELVSSHLAHAPEDRHQLIRQNFITIFQNEVPESVPSEARALGGKVHDELARCVKSLVGELLAVDADSFAHLQTMSAASLVDSTIQAVGRHHAALESFSDPELLRALQSWKLDYQRQVRSEHGFIEPPDFERKRKIPIESLYVAPRIQPNGSDDSLGINEFAATVDRSVLLGDPGGGKSTAANYLAFASANSDEARIPFFVVLRDFARDQELETSIADFITDRCASLYQCPPPPGAVEHLLLGGQALVIFDGLDEMIDTSRRREVTRRVELFLQRYPLTAGLVTSRRVGYEQAQLDPAIFHTSSLTGFNADDVEQYVENWFTAVEELEDEARSSAQASFIEESKSVPDLTATPLMLALMCIIYRGQGYIPKNRPAVYEHCAKLLFEKWDSSRKIFVELRAAAQVDDAIKHLAYWMLTEQSGIEAVMESELVRETSDYLRGSIEDSHERARAAQEFVDFCRGRAWVLSDAGTTAEGEALFKFTHRTFMEYFAAYEVTRRTDGPEELAKVLLPKVAAQEWDVVGQLAVQICNKHSLNGAERVFAFFLADRRRRSLRKRDNIHAFVWRCLSFVHVGPSFVRALMLASVESSFNAREVSSSTGRLGGQEPSILFCTGVLPELRATLAEALSEKLLSMARDEAPDRCIFGKISILGWGIAATGGTEPSPAVTTFWKGWKDKVVADNLKVLMSAGPGERDAWLIALLHGYVEMDDFLSASREWADRALDVLFTAQQESHFGVRYAAWVVGAIRTVTQSPKWGEGDVPNHVAQRRVQLGQLGRHLTPERELPWLSSLPRTTMMGFRPVVDWDQTHQDDDACWALWVLLACEIETHEHRRVAIRAAAARNRDDLVIGLMETRRAGGSLENPYSGTMFESMTESRGMLRDRWTRNDVSLIEDAL